MSQKHLRRKFLVDRHVQGSLVSRAARYWLLSLFVVGALTVLGWIFVSPGVEVLVNMRDQFPSLLGALLVSLAASMIVLPVLLYDLVKHTNRFAGPIYRLNRVMRDAAAGLPVEPLQFRTGDYWEEMAQSFNRILERLQEQQVSTNESDVPEFDTIQPAKSLQEPASV